MYYRYWLAVWLLWLLRLVWVLILTKTRELGKKQIHQLQLLLSSLSIQHAPLYVPNLLLYPHVYFHKPVTDSIHRREIGGRRLYTCSGSVGCLRHCLCVVNVVDIVQVHSHAISQLGNLLSALCKT